MSMRLILNVTLGLVLVAALSGSVLAQAPQSKTEGIVTAGALAGSNDGSQNRLNEYEVAKDGTLPQFGAKVWGNKGTFTFDLLASHGGDNRDQKYGAYLSGAGGDDAFGLRLGCLREDAARQGGDQDEAQRHFQNGTHAHDGHLATGKWPCPGRSRPATAGRIRAPCCGSSCSACCNPA